MKYPYIVVKNGIWYSSGADVPEGPEKVDNDKKMYSKSEISRMPIAELKALAESENIADFNAKTGAELKKLLIEKFEL